MKAAAASTLALLAVSSRTASACVELQGIVPDGGEGLLDYLVLQSSRSLGSPLAPLNIFENPTIGTVSEARLVGRSSG